LTGQLNRRPQPRSRYSEKISDATQLLVGKRAGVISDNVGAETIRKNPDSDDQRAFPASLGPVRTTAGKARTVLRICASRWVAVLHRDESAAVRAAVVGEIPEATETLKYLLQAPRFQYIFRVWFNANGSW